MDHLDPMRELPLGLAMALAQNSGAMDVFTSLPPEGRRRVVEGTHDIHSKREMAAYVSALAEQKEKPASPR